MLSSRQYLHQCEELQRLGFEFEAEIGQIIARGFADLGYEEFSVIASDKIVSLYTGQISKLKAEESKFFFLVPTCDELISYITKRNMDIQRLEYIHQRVWRLSAVSCHNNEAKMFEAKNIKEVLMQSLLDTYRQ